MVSNFLHWLFHSSHYLTWKWRIFQVLLIMLYEFIASVVAFSFWSLFHLGYYIVLIYLLEDLALHHLLYFFGIYCFFVSGVVVLSAFYHFAFTSLLFYQVLDQSHWSLSLTCFCWNLFLWNYFFRYILRTSSFNICSRIHWTFFLNLFGNSHTLYMSWNYSLNLMLESFNSVFRLIKVTFQLIYVSLL